MIEKYFKCKLLTDIVINASLATEGNMKTLDYIPGSNFLGIVAKNYSDYEKDEAYDIFHSENVSFGDAHISKGSSKSYAMPFALFTDKLNKEVAGDDAEVWVHHILEKYNPQHKQHRGGYLNPNKLYIPKVEKRFALKSAQDRDTRKSKDEAMFGFESMKKGQKFIFSVRFKEDKYVDEIIKILDGKQRVGKSKTAQYGQVEITEINKPALFENGDANGQLVIYAESNLCFFNEYGQPTFQPTAKDFGLEGKGKINWAASQIRTYSYSPWNAHRGTTDTQRDCISKGSVIVFDFDKDQTASVPTKNMVGAFQAEGLGRVIYNPEFLKADKNTGLWAFDLLPPIPKKDDDRNGDGIYKTQLGKFLFNRKNAIDDELKVGKAVFEFINENSKNGIFKNITSSQWGGIRSIAIKADNQEQLIEKLFNKEKGALTNGVAADRYWNKKNGKARIILEQAIKGNTLGNAFVVKLAAEMAKLKQKSNDN